MDGIWEGKTISQFLRSGLGARRALGKNVAQNAVLYSAAGALKIDLMAFEQVVEPGA